jgi:hypothetical protein
MGRRNSLFSGSEGGAESWAIIASIVNTAKLHDLDPQAYLTDILERIVSGRTRSHQLHELLACVAAEVILPKSAEVKFPRAE